jgi:hypothetical protein
MIDHNAFPPEGGFRDRRLSAGTLLVKTVFIFSNLRVFEVSHPIIDPTPDTVGSRLHS